MNFSNLKIGARLGAGIGALLALVVVISGIGIYSLDKAGEQTHDMVSVMDDGQKITEWVGILETVSEMSMGYLLNPATTAEDDKRVRERTQELDERAIDLGHGVTPHSDGARKLFATIFGDEKVFLNARTEAMRLKVEAKAPQAQVAQYTMQTYLPALRTLTEDLTKLKGAAQKLAQAQEADTRASFQSSNVMLYVFAAIAVLIGAAVGWALTRGITHPLAEAVKVANGVAAGDLTQRIGTQRRDEVGELLKALGAMNDRLRNVVAEVREGVDSVSNASAQVAQGNSDLSARTEQTAASLEQTAASIEELTSTVVQSADTAQQANQLASQAARSAENGGKVVSEVVTSMQQISASSKKIADIISVIDGIAFQTNILALNAAVEAARAGEQGRGFAVVAGEVRALAQRSAEAAKEIKGLIDNSVQTVETGSAQVAQAGKSMEEIVANVKRVSDLIGEIAAATNEQRDGINQINQAVSNLDQMTQQNAALVEESTAAAASMRDQSHRLAEVVSVFNVGASELSAAHSRMESIQHHAQTQVHSRAKALHESAQGQVQMSIAAHQKPVPPKTAPKALPVLDKPVAQPRPAPTVASSESEWESF